MLEMAAHRDPGETVSCRLPAEWEPHEATWLSYPHEPTTWPGGIGHIFASYHDFVRVLSTGETVHLLVQDHTAVHRVRAELSVVGAVMERVELHVVPTNDAWCRDHGPCFVQSGDRQVIVNWGFNAWGGKYPYDLDSQVPVRVAGILKAPLVDPGLILEGGAIDVNGAGCLLTTASCLLNPNRNPQCSRTDIEMALQRYLGVRQVIWLGEGIAGDDTDGHVDDITRFTGEATVVTAVEPNPSDVNAGLLRQNRDRLRAVRLPDGRPLDVVELPMPAPVYHGGARLPASYANFYIGNAAVIMPTFRCREDEDALAILQSCFDRPVVGIDAYDIIQGLGSFHCLSRQQPQSAARLPSLEHRSAIPPSGPCSG